MADNLSELFAEMAGKFDPDAWGSEDAVLQFNIGDKAWVATIEGGNLSIDEGAVDSPAMTMTCSEEDILAMAKGDLNPVSAFMQGKIKIDGNMSLAMKLQSLIG